MSPNAPSEAQPSGHVSSADLDKWLELGLLVASGGAILVVVAWIESALAG